MEFTHQHVFAAPLERVIAMFADDAFAQRRAKASGSGEGEVWVDGTADTAFTVYIRRTVPASSIPSEFRSFVGSELHVRYTEAWQEPEPDARVGTFAVEISGTPGHVAGALGLTANGESTTFLATGDVKVSVPLFGGMIERTVAEAVGKGLAQELEAADAWLQK